MAKSILPEEMKEMYSDAFQMAENAFKERETFIVTRSQSSAQAALFFYLETIELFMTILVRMF